MSTSLCKLIKHTFVFGGGLQTDYLIFKKKHPMYILHSLVNSSDLTGHLGLLAHFSLIQPFFLVFVPFKLGFAVADRERQATGSKWLCKTAPVTILKGVLQILDALNFK